MLLRKYPPQIRSVLEELGITAELGSAHFFQFLTQTPWNLSSWRNTRKWPRQSHAYPAAATAWKQLAAAALHDNVNLQIVSAFRSFQRQTEIVRQKLDSGLSIDAILSVSALPASANITPDEPWTSPRWGARRWMWNSRAPKRSGGFRYTLSGSVSRCRTRKGTSMDTRTSPGTGVFMKPGSNLTVETVS